MFVKPIHKDIEKLESGIVPDSMNYNLESHYEDLDKQFLENTTYKTITPEFYIKAFDPVLIEMYPCLMDMVMEEYEKNKHRTPLEEIMELQKITVDISKLSGDTIIEEDVARTEDKSGGDSEHQQTNADG